MRTRLPNRRGRIAADIEVDGQQYVVSCDPDARELFLEAAKPNSTLDRILNDAAIVISVARQHGVEIQDLRKSVGDSIIGAALDFLAVQKERDDD